MWNEFKIGETVGLDGTAEITGIEKTSDGKIKYTLQLYDDKNKKSVYVIATEHYLVKIQPEFKEQGIALN